MFLNRIYLKTRIMLLGIFFCFLIFSLFHFFHFLFFIKEKKENLSKSFFIQWQKSDIASFPSGKLM